MASTHISLLTERGPMFSTAGYKHLAPPERTLIFCTAGYRHPAPPERGRKTFRCAGMASVRFAGAKCLWPTHKKATRLRRSRMCHGVLHIPLLTERTLILCTAGYKHLAPPERARKTFRCAGMASVRFAGAKCLLAHDKKETRLRRSRMCHGVHAHLAPHGAGANVFYGGL